MSNPKPLINVTIIRVDGTNTFFQAEGWRAAAEQAVKYSADTFYAPGFKVFMSATDSDSAPEEHTPSSLNADLIDGNVPA